MALVIDGTTLKELQPQLEAWYKPGKKLALDIGLPRDLSAEELAVVQQKFLDEGLKLLAPLEIGSSDRWPNTLRLEFESPRGFAQGLPLVVLIILALGVVGIAAILGWRIGEVVGAVTKYFPALCIFGLVGVLGYAYISRRA